MRSQRGAYLTLLAVLIVVLIGMAALVLDTGRTLSLRAEMQSAADAAALAAAMELDGGTDAIARARDAARNLLQHQGRFAEVSDLLGNAGLPDEAFDFFCVIGSPTDVSPEDGSLADFCSSTTETEPGKYAALLPEEAHYVRVRLDAEIAEGGRYTIGLDFLPVLNSGDDEEPMDQVRLSASALAGRTFFTCNFPPVALCDPFESSGGNFREDMTPGAHIQLRQQGSNQWSHGNFGFLEPGSGGTGAASVSLYVADEGNLGCNPPIITTQTGSMTNKMAAAFNTRLDIYDDPAVAPFNKPDAYETWPPAPNVMEYPLDESLNFIDSRFGLGDWDFDQYWLTNHPATMAPNGWSNFNRPSRWEVYNWEIENASIPASGQPDPGHLHTGSYPPAISNAERRLLHVAVLSCEALGLTGGKKSGVVFSPDGFAEIFLMRKAEGPPNSEVYGEYLGWTGEGDENYHVEVQLYE